MEYLTCFFNSSLFKFAFKDYFPELLGDTRELRKVFFDTIPLKLATDEVWYKEILGLILTKKTQGLSTATLEAEVDEKLFDLYQLTTAERAIICPTLGLAAPSLDSISATSLADNE